MSDWEKDRDLEAERRIPVDPKGWGLIPCENDKALSRRDAFRDGADFGRSWRAGELEKVRESLETVSRQLNGIKYDLESRVYTLNDDEFSKVWFSRDVADRALAILDGLK